MKGIVKEEIEYEQVIGYTINDLPIDIHSEDIAKLNVGKEVNYEVTTEGYRKFGMFTEDFYKRAILEL